MTYEWTCRKCGKAQENDGWCEGFNEYDCGMECECGEPHEADFAELADIHQSYLIDAAEHEADRIVYEKIQQNGGN